MIRTIAMGSCALALATLAGCATEYKFTANMNSWVGKPESEVVARWGTPTMVFERDGTRSITYATSQPMVIPPATSTASGAPAPTLPPRDFAVVYSCRVQMPIADGKVASWWEVQGRSCIAG